MALIGDNKGIINAKSSVTAKGYSSIIALAQKKGKVNVEGTITAKDEWAAKDSETKPYLYNNIGVYAGSGGIVTINGAHDIYGIGAMASGENSVVNLKGGGTIETGQGAALVATNKGLVNYYGGTIIHKEHETGDHDGTTPLYTDNSSRINFKGATQINISHGILMPGKSEDYEAKDTGIAKYNGMENVTVNLTGNNVILATNNGETTNWTGSTSGSNGVKENMKLAALNTNGKDYKIYYINGTFNLNNNLNLDDSTDEFNKSVGLSNEVFNIAANVVVSSTAGKGLAMGSNETATSNATNSYTNNGTVNITGGSLATGTIGFNVSYGQINNNKIISVEDGIGAYGINGSKLTNAENAKINITKQGIGMVAFTSADKLQTYGTDKKISTKMLTNSDKTFEIINKGEITVNGDKSVGLYGHTNDAKDKPAGLILTAENGLITNSGKLILTGDETVGIVSKKAKVVLEGKGSSDIIVGKKGIGVYAEKSPVIINTNYGIEVKEGGTGIFIKNDGSSLTTAARKVLELKYSGSKTGTGLALFYEGKVGLTNTNTTNVKLVDTVSTTGGLVALYAKGGGKLINNASLSGEKGYGIITEGTEIENRKTIKFTSAITPEKATVGIYTKASDKITNQVGAKIELEENSIAIYGHEVDQSGEIIVGDGSTAIYSEGGTVDLKAGSLTKVGKKSAAAVYTKGSNQTITAHSGSILELGNTSFGFINEGKGNTLISNITAQNLGMDSVYIYSNDKTGTVINNTKLKSTGSYNYAIYSSGTVTNNADIDFTVGDGNVGVYSIYGVTATNSATKRIAVGKSYIDAKNSLNNRYSIGMAAGFTPEPTDTRLPYTGTIINEGTISATGDYSIAMYGSGNGTKVYNGTSIGSTATLELGASNTTGMYLDNGAYGYNYGTIKSIGTGLKEVVGVVVKNGSTIENHGHIEITAKDARGILAKGDVAGNNLGIIKNYGTFNINGITDPENPEVIYEDKDTSKLGKTMGNVSIKVAKNPPKATIEVDGKIVEPKTIDTSASKYKEMQVSKIGMYIDTSNERFTKPIAGLSALSSLKKADLILGTEATQSTNSKYIQVGKKILEPYNKMILNNPQVEKWNIYSNSLTWMGEITQNQTTGVIENAYLAKAPYTNWAGNEASPVDKKDSFNFLDGLEQRYGVEALGSKENKLFQKINGIGKNEEILFFQAIDEMMGHQYANIQQRIHSTGQILDKEFDYLKDEWRTASKDSNKVKVFGMKGDYSTDTAGVIDYKNNAYGVAYVGENETIKLGKSSGWYTGLVHNKFDFKDIGNSKEEMLQAKLGLFNTMAFDDNGSLNWTISGEVFAGYNKMNRRFLVVDEIFNARSRYWSYGVALKNELSKTFRLSEDFSLRGYASLKAEYGRFQTIKEKSGEIRLDIKANDYISVKPEIGGELIYKTPLSGRNFFNAKLGVKYDNELGRIADAKNKARVAHTTADWFNIRGEKEDRKGNIGADLSLGWDNEAYGITANIGYDTKGKNRRAGLGLRVIF